MLNIYNVPPSKNGMAGLWFEFPGRIDDSYVNENGVCIASHETPSMENGRAGRHLYKLQTKAFRKARSAREAVRIIGTGLRWKACQESGRTFLIADSREGWVLSVVKGRTWVAQRVPDDEIMIISGRFNIQETDLRDTANFIGSKRLARKARREGWNFAKTYSAPSILPGPENTEAYAKARELFFGDSLSLEEAPFSSRPVRKFHRRDLSKLLSEAPIHNENTALTTIFTLNPNYPAAKGTVIWVGFPGQDAANHSQWTIFTKSPESCHRYDDASMAMDRHFLDTGGFRERWPNISTGTISFPRPTSMSFHMTTLSTSQRVSVVGMTHSTTTSMSSETKREGCSMLSGLRDRTRLRMTRRWCTPAAQTEEKPGRSRS